LFSEGDGSVNPSEITNQEMQLLVFIRQLGWGEIRIRVENGGPVLIYEAIRTLKLDDAGTGGGAKKRPASQAPEPLQRGPEVLK
jgi:hypothetical protein